LFVHYTPPLSALNIDRHEKFAMFIYGKLFKTEHYRVGRAFHL